MSDRVAILVPFEKLLVVVLLSQFWYISHYFGIILKYLLHYMIWNFVFIHYQMPLKVIFCNEGHALPYGKHAKLTSINFLESYTLKGPKS